LWKQEPCEKSLARFFLTAAVLFPDGSVAMVTMIFSIIRVGGTRGATAGNNHATHHITAIIFTYVSIGQRIQTAILALYAVWYGYHK
jgi:hypothetical protein